MGQDATKVLLGTTTSSFKTITCENADPASFPAGTAVRRKDDGALQTNDDATAAIIGVSVGKSLSNHKKTSVVRKGLGVPLRLKVAYASGVATIGSYADMTDGGPDTFTVGDVEFAAQTAAVDEGDATFQAAVSDAATAASLANQINTNDDTKDIVGAVVDGDTVVITAKDLGDAGNSIVLLFGNETTNTAGSVTGSGTLEGGIDSPAELGKPVYVNDDGFGCASGDEDAAATGATYAGEILTGVEEITHDEAFVALIDIRGVM